MDKIAIVILNWNGVGMMEKFLPSVLQYSIEDGATVYVADNASTDNSMQMLKEKFPQVRTIQLEKNWGFAEGYNKALAQIDAEYYVLLNSDVEVTHHWLVPSVSPSCFLRKTATLLNMPGRQADISTSTAIPSAVAGYSIPLRPTTDIMTIPPRYYGLQAPAL